MGNSRGSTSLAVNAAFGGAGKALSNLNFLYYWVGDMLSILRFWLNKLALGVFTWAFRGLLQETDNLERPR